MKPRTVLVSGAGVAGPSVAYWLARQGMRVTVVERAPALREGGQAVDFRGPVHLGLLERMGVLEAIRARRTVPTESEMVFVDEQGRRTARMDASFASGELEILRGDLARILHEATRSSCEYVFGDSIRALDERPDRVGVTFVSGRTRDFDLVIGADGLHSNVRALAFGDEARFVRREGYFVGIFALSDAFGRDANNQACSLPGRAACVFGGSDSEPPSAFLCFASPSAEHDRLDVDGQKRVLAEAFAGMGWQVPALLGELARADDLYFDSISQVHMERWSGGRVVLLGDAGYGGTLGGMGTGLAVVAAYVLAAELGTCDDLGVALLRYESEIRDHARECQRGSASVGPFLAPKSASRIWLRDRLLNALYRLPGKGFMDRITSRRAKGITLADYEARGMLR